MQKAKQEQFLFKRNNVWDMEENILGEKKHKEKRELSLLLNINFQLGNNLLQV